MPIPNPLYAITDSALTSDQLFAACTEILSAGCTWLQYRDKGQDNERRVYQAQTLQQLCQRHGAQLLINDDIALAHRVGAAGVHLGQGDTPIAQARALLGAKAIIGITCHGSLALADTADKAGANYLAFGRFFASHTKPDAPLAELSLLQQARARFPGQTLVAIGGINTDNAATLIAAGADRVALCHALFYAPDKIACVQQLAALAPSSTNYF